MGESSENHPIRPAQNVPLLMERALLQTLDLSLPSPQSLTGCPDMEAVCGKPQAQVEDLAVVSALVAWHTKAGMEGAESG